MNEGDGRIVLIVEDEALVREVAADEFEDSGYTVLAAADAEAALQIIESDQNIDLLFTDIRIPGVLDGWAIACHARSLRPELPVIYATGFSADQLQMVGGARFFRKPYRVAAVLDAARELMSAV